MLLVSKCLKCNCTGQVWVNKKSFSQVFSEVCRYCNIELDYVPENTITDPEVFLDYIENKMAEADWWDQLNIPREIHKKMCLLLDGVTFDSIPVKLEVAKIVKDSFAEAMK